MASRKNQFPKLKCSTYKNIRRRIKNGDILLCSGNAAFSKMIQKATNSIWSHVAFVMWLEKVDRLMVLESVEPIGIRTVPLSSYLKDYNGSGKGYNGGVAILRHDDFEKSANEKALKQFGQFAVEHFSYPYDKDQLAKIALRIMMGHLPFSKKEKEDLKRDKEYICSEYVWECYKHIGIDVPYDDLGFISPANFFAAPKMKIKYVLKDK